MGRAWCGHTYIGEEKAGKLHGSGKITWSNGNAYEGEFSHGKMEGMGKLTFGIDSAIFPARKGDVYFGEWKRSKWTGRGKLMDAMGNVLQSGEWQDNVLVKTDKDLQDIALKGRQESDGFILRPVSNDDPTWASLSELLGKELSLARVWKVEHPVNRFFYEAGLERAVHEIERFEAQSAKKAKEYAALGLPTKTHELASKLLDPIRPEANEAMLVHGTSPEVVLNILSSGMTEKFAGTKSGAAFGKGIYFAEDVKKANSYAKVDRHHDASSDLHKYIYDTYHDTHPGDVCYLFVCRVALGLPLRTTQSGDKAKDMDESMPIFPQVFGELASVPNVMPPMHYHSLIAERTHREFIVFHNEYATVEYLLAYKRAPVQ